MKLPMLTLVFHPIEKKGQNNLAFATHFQLGDAVACVDLLVKTKRAPEAALFARTYAPRFAPSYLFQNDTSSDLTWPKPVKYRKQ